MTEHQELKFQPPQYLSASSMGTFNQCPLKFKYNKIDGLTEPPTEATLLGNFVHEILEGLYALPVDERNVASVKSIAGQVWHSSDWEQRIDGYVHPTKVRNFRWSAWFCVENLFKVENPKSIEVRGIEFEVNGKLGPAHIKGFIDRFENDSDDLVVVSDYKTGKTPKAAWVKDKFVQLKLYAAMLHELDVASVSSLQLLYLKDGVKFTHRVTDEDIRETVSYVTQTYDRIMKACETGNFTYNKSKLCDWCTFKKVCPAWKRESK